MKLGRGSLPAIENDCCNLRNVVRLFEHQAVVEELYWRSKKTE
jgi:hypothetical protein